MLKILHLPILRNIAFYGVYMEEMGKNIALSYLILCSYVFLKHFGLVLPSRITVIIFVIMIMKLGYTIN